MRTQKTLLMVAVSALVLAAAPALAFPSGSYTLNNNNTSTDVSLTRNTFATGGYTNSFPSSITHGTSGSGSASSTTDTLMGAVDYTEPVHGYGCTFSTNVTKSGSVYSFTFNKSVLGGAGSPAICNFSGMGNSTTGAFTATGSISGF
jgi:hypothetical protein